MTLMVKQQVTLGRKDSFRGYFRNFLIITLKPLVTLMPDVACVMATFHRPQVIHNRKQFVSEIIFSMHKLPLTNVNHEIIISGHKKIRSSGS